MPLFTSLLFLLCSVLLSHTSAISAPKEIEEKLLTNDEENVSQLGTYFFLGFPPNMSETHPPSGLYIFVGAMEETNIKMMNSSEVLFETSIPASTVATFSTEGGQNTFPLSWTFENWDNERPMQNKSVILETDKPVSVYVLNSKVTTTEGYMAIPVEAWGMEYIHCSFYDFKETSINWGGGFQVLAAENDTRITIDMKGTGASIGETSEGKKIGDKIRITLDKGEIYQIQGSGETRGIFDISGSIITANKPFGVISYHNRTMIPKQIVQNGRNHLVSMMPPTNTWGRKYATIEMDRSTGKGDYFRVVSATDNNDVTFSWFDDETNQLIDRISVSLSRGEVWSPYEIDGDLDTDPPLVGVNGLMLVESTKPICLMQYSYSSFWDDKTSSFEPMMFPVTPVEQFTDNAYFQTAETKGQMSSGLFRDNTLSLLFLGDEDGDVAKTRQLAESIIIDGEALTAWDPTAGLRKIPNTNICYTRLKLDQGLHHITGDTKFGAYLYGFSDFDSYAWPAVTAYNDLTSLGINEAKDLSEAGYRIFPNPSSIEARISGISEGATISLISTDGASISADYSISAGEAVINTQGLATGQYLILLQDGGAIFKGKLMVK